MKLKISILTLVILSTTASLAQKINYGIKAGLNVSSLRADYYEEFNASARIGYHAGVFLEYAINDKLAIQPELLYSTQGGESDTEKYEEADFYLGINPIPKLSYLNLPVLLKYKIIKNLSIEFGPQIGYVLSAETNAEYIDSSRRETVKIDILHGGNYTFLSQNVEIEPGIERWDYGLNFGTSYDITKQLFAQARYYLGLAGIDKPSARNRTRDWDAKNAVLQFSLGYRF